MDQEVNGFLTLQDEDRLLRMNNLMEVDMNGFNRYQDGSDKGLKWTPLDEAWNRHQDDVKDTAHGPSEVN